MPDDSSHDDCPQREELQNPAVRKAIEATYNAFFDAIGNQPLKYHEIIFSIGQAAARIADTVYANIEASIEAADVGEETVSAVEFHVDVMLETSECLEDLLGIEIDAGDDEETNEPYQHNVTTH
jgi:hypothetical protein